VAYHDYDYDCHAMLGRYVEDMTVPAAAVWQAQGGRSITGRGRHPYLGELASFT
jgi:hypothetical protein